MAGGPAAGVNLQSEAVAQKKKNPSMSPDALFTATVASEMKLFPLGCILSTQPCVSTRKPVHDAWFHANKGREGERSDGKQIAISYMATIGQNL